MDQNDYNKELEDKLNDISLYGEFMSTFNYWVSSEEQKTKYSICSQLKVKGTKYKKQ